MEMTIREFVAKYDNGEIDSPDGWDDIEDRCPLDAIIELRADGTIYFVDGGYLGSWTPPRVQTREERLLNQLELPQIEDNEHFQIDWADDNRFFSVSVCVGKTHIAYVEQSLDSHDYVDSKIECIDDDGQVIVVGEITQEYMGAQAEKTYTALVVKDRHDGVIGVGTDIYAAREDAEEWVEYDVYDAVTDYDSASPGEIVEVDCDYAVYAYAKKHGLGFGNVNYNIDNMILELIWPTSKIR